MQQNHWVTTQTDLIPFVAVLWFTNTCTVQKRAPFRITNQIFVRFVADLMNISKTHTKKYFFITRTEELNPSYCYYLAFYCCRCCMVHLSMLWNLLLHVPWFIENCDIIWFECVTTWHIINYAGILYKDTLYSFFHIVVLVSIVQFPVKFRSYLCLLEINTNSRKT